MELGALVCRPTQPDCAGCPLNTACGAHQAHEVDRFPEPKPRTRVVRVERAAVQLVRPDGRFLLVQRPPQGLLASMWELPAAEVPPLSRAEDAASRLLRQLGSRARPRFLGQAEHRFSHRHWTVQVFQARTRSTRLAGTWVGWEDLADLALPTASRKVLRVIQGAVPA